MKGDHADDLKEYWLLDNWGDTIYNQLELRQPFVFYEILGEKLSFGQKERAQLIEGWSLSLEIQSYEFCQKREELWNIYTIKMQ